METAIFTGKPILRIAREFQVGEPSLRHHRNMHVSEAVKKASGIGAVVQADTLLAKIKGLEADARRIGAAAEESGDGKTALQAVREIARICELLGKLTGELQTGNSTINVNVSMGPLPEISELAARFTQLDTPEAAARRKWLSEGGPLPKHLVSHFLPRPEPVGDVVEGEIINHK